MDKITQILTEKGYTEPEIEKAKGGVGQWVRDKIGRFASKPGGGGGASDLPAKSPTGWKKSISTAGGRTTVRYRGDKNDLTGNKNGALFTHIRTSMTKNGWKSTGARNPNTGHGRQGEEGYIKGNRRAFVNEHGSGDIEVTFG